MDYDWHSPLQVDLVFGESSHLRFLIEYEIDALLGPINPIVEAHKECSFSIGPKNTILDDWHLDDQGILVHIEEILSEEQSVSGFIEYHLENQII